MNPQMNMNNDRQHLKLLSIFHYIMGGILAFFFLFPLIHFTIGLLIITESISVHSSGNLPPQAAGYFFRRCWWPIFHIRRSFCYCYHCIGAIPQTPPEILVFLRYGLHPLLIHSLGDNPRSLHDYCSLPPVRQGAIRAS